MAFRSLFALGVLSTAIDRVLAAAVMAAAESTVVTSRASAARAADLLMTRQEEGICDGQWRPGPNPGDDDYLRPADGPQVMSGLIYGGAGGKNIKVAGARTQSWSTTIEMPLGIADVLSLGLSFSSSFEESITDTTTHSFSLPAGEEGSITFTPYMRCSIGSGTCNGEAVEGEVCTPYETTRGAMGGEWGLTLRG